MSDPSSTMGRDAASVMGWGQEGLEKSTHETVAAKLRALADHGTVDVSKMEHVKVDMLSMMLHAGPLTYEKYASWRNLVRMEEIQHQQANKTADDPLNTTRSDRFLLANAVYCDDGSLFGPELTEELVTAPGAGPTVHRLVQAVNKMNPPREYLAVEVAAMLSKNAVDLALWRVLLDVGLGQALIQAMAPSATEAEREWAEHQIRIVDETVYALMPMFEAEDAAKHLGITFRDAMERIANPETAAAVAAASNEDEGP